MNVMTFFGRTFTGRAQLAEKAADVLGYRVVHDQELIEAAAKKFLLEAADIQKSIYEDPPYADRYSAAKACCIAAVKSVLAEEVQKGRVVFSGLLGELIPPQIGLHLLVTASDQYRQRRLQEAKRLAGTDGQGGMRRLDETFLRWSLYLRVAESRKPTDFDGVVNVSRTGHSELIELISNAAAKKETNMNPREFSLAARISWVMAEKGHPVAVSTQKKQVSLMVHKPVLMLSRYGKKLASLAGSLEGVDKVKTHAGPLFYRPDIYPGCEFTPSLKVSCRPIERQYEQLYAQVADCRQSFLRKEDVPVLVCSGHA